MASGLEAASYFRKREIEKFMYTLIIYTILRILSRIIFKCGFYFLWNKLADVRMGGMDDEILTDWPEIC